MSKNYKYINVYVDTDIDVRLGDIMDQLDNDDLIDELLSRDISFEEKIRITQHFESGLKNDRIPWTLQDQMKFNIIKEAFNKYTIEQLEEKLK